MSRFKQLWFLLIAIVLFLPTAPIVFLINSIRFFNHDYWLQVAIGIDQLGGSILYNEEDWTISSYTHLLCSVCKKYCWFEKFINFWFGKGHCAKSYKHEKRKIVKEGSYGLR